MELFYEMMWVVLAFREINLKHSQISSTNEMMPIPKTSPSSPPTLEKKLIQVMVGWLPILKTADLRK